MTIHRTVTLPEAFYPAGFSLVHYIGRVLAHRHPALTPTLTFTERGCSVQITIEAGAEEQQIVEESLELYSNVLRRITPLNTLFSNMNAIMELKQRLDLSALELRITEGLLEEEDVVSVPESFVVLEEKVKNLHFAVGNALAKE